MDDVVRRRLLQLVLMLSSSPAPASKVIAKKKKIKSRKHLHDEEDGGYECRSCGRRFKTFQALGGHRTSHNRRPPTAGSRKLAAAAEHRCGTCGLVFGTGQALGGHMRRHFTRPPAAAAWSTEAMASAGRREEEDDDDDHDAWVPRLIQFI
ncbi:zinc finger protein ZAT11 [Brachypodium distachyon]|uniref:C2H2-type domain-containing protein n=1 Tax=Brachypodium distachyon TaxID=15368 RepID=I1IJ53_BRADI|nr:zinc finger protein ZAT11 [Brachypodium distachyon]KQJ87106.1 hypothetical protein BRADI_4g09410v3 [Brachypodium distachyon]|eukprot:XP_010238980.1 zinc finger protein ZAT11 [Brachypodium distachyon]